MSTLVGVHKPESWKDESALIARAIAEEHFVLVSAVGVLIVSERAVALQTFRNCLSAYAAMLREDFLLVSVIDPDGREAIGYAVNEPERHYLYGFSSHEIMLEFADLQGVKQ